MASHFAEAEQECVRTDYVRVKHETTTMFVYFQPTDTDTHLRAKLSAITEQSAERIKLFLDESGVCARESPH
tara:strand:+ start:505 stop:720 length:216 start_codon:yes stop_codon:yes gene_type:complete